jgi:acetyl-CoA synthetase
MKPIIETKNGHIANQIDDEVLKRFLEVTEFTSYEDFMKNYKLKIPEDFNFGYDVVDYRAKVTPNKIALLWANDHGEERIFTYADIKKQSDSAASFFQSLGIGRGDRVLLMLKRRWQFWITIIAIHKLGAIAIPASHLLSSKEFAYRCNRAQIKAILIAGDHDTIDPIEQHESDCPSVTIKMSIGPHIPEGWIDYNQGVSEAKTFTPPKRANANNYLSLIYFTSGTTGQPKMVAHDFTYPLGHIVTAAFWHNVNSESRHLTLADTGWAKAVWGKLYGQWIMGATIFVYDYERFSPGAVLKMIEHYRLTSFCAPPTVYRTMLQHGVSGHDLSSLENCTIAGEALNPVLYDKWLEATGLQLKEGYGQTETALLVATYPWVEPRPGSMGKAGPHFDVDLVDADGKSCQPHEQGEIIVRFPNGKRPAGLFLGYIDDQRMTKHVMRSKVYHTGDAAWRDEDGYYWFTGRIDDVIKSAGYRIGPFEVESILLRHKAVAEVAVTGVPDDLRGQAVKATIVLKPAYKDCDQKVLIRELQNQVRQNTANYKVPRVIQFVDSLPKTVTGKIKRSAVREMDNQQNNNIE